MSEKLKVAGDGFRLVLCDQQSKDVHLSYLKYLDQ